MGTLDLALVPRFAAQHWLVSRQQVMDAGGTDRQVDRRLASGVWERVDAGVYRLAGAPTPWEARVLAPLLSVGSGAVASHLCAARLHGIAGFGRATPEITIPRGAGARRADLRVHTSTDLDRTTPVLRHGVPVTSIDRTLLDLGRYVGDSRLLRAIEWARRSDQTTWAALIRTLRRHARRGRPGVARLRRLITANAHRDEITDSDFELLFLALLAEHGLPEPTLHHRVLDGQRFVAEVDLAYPLLKIAIELDGLHHLEREVRERDLPRQNDLVLLGWTVLRFSWERLAARPELVIAEVTAALRVPRVA